MRNKKGQANIGLVSSLVFGIAGLIVGIIISFLVVQTLTEANLLDAGEETSTVTNETLASANATGYTLDEYNANTRHTYAISTVWADWNQTIDATNDPSGYNVSVPTSNVTLSSGIVTNASVIDYPNVSLSYTYATYTDTDYSAGMLSGNFTEGVDEVSDNISTILLIAAIVLILGLLAVLVTIWQKMRMGQTAGL